MGTDSMLRWIWMGNKPSRVFGNRETNLLSLYGLTLEAYSALEQVQNYCCKICGKHKSDNKEGVLAVDHDHGTGRIRGLLCNNCNTMLGYAKDSPTTLLKAIQYLKGNL
jgi:hypothetical protein